MKCYKCDTEIPEARLLAVPGTKTCVKCSTVKPYRAIINGTASHKGFTVDIVKEDSDALRYEEERKKRRE